MYREWARVSKCIQSRPAEAWRKHEIEQKVECSRATENGKTAVIRDIRYPDNSHAHLTQGVLLNKNCSVRIDRPRQRLNDWRRRFTARTEPGSLKLQSYVRFLTP